MAVTRAMVVAIATAILCAAATPAAAQDASRRMVLQVDVEPEPGKVVVTDWFGLLLELRMLMSAPRDEDAKVIAYVRARGDLAAPPLLMEMGRRISTTNPVEGSYWYRLGWMRMLWAAHQCAEDMSWDAVQILSASMAESDPDLAERLDEPAIRLAAFERLGDADAVFEDRVSAWWLCSYGAPAAARATMNADPGVTATATLAEWRSPAGPRDAYEAEVRAAMPQWTAAARADLAALAR